MGSVWARRRAVDGAEEQGQVVLWVVRPRRVLRRRGLTLELKFHWRRMRNVVLNYSMSGNISSFSLFGHSERHQGLKIKTSGLK